MDSLPADRADGTAQKLERRNARNEFEKRVSGKVEKTKSLGDRIKALGTRNVGMGGALQLHGSGLGYTAGEEDNAEEEVEKKTQGPAAFDLRSLIEEAARGEPPTPAATQHPNQTGEEAQLEAGEIEEYDPNQPLLSKLSVLMQKIRASNLRRSNREATALYEHNPHLLHHMLAGARYTISFCRKCTSTRRCRAHGETLQLSTSVSLCPHKRMVLYWGVNDASNRLGSWKLEIKDYARQDHGFGVECRGCDVFRPSERVPLLAERVVADMRRERLRSSERRVREEVLALVGAWEYARLRELERKERERQAYLDRLERERMAAAKRMEEQRRAQEALAETLRLVQRQIDAQKEKEKGEKRTEGRADQKKRRRSSASSALSSRSSKKLRLYSPGRAPSQSPTVFHTAPSTPPPAVIVTPSASPSSFTQRQRSIGGSPSTETIEKMAKKVRFTPEVEERHPCAKAKDALSACNLCIFRAGRGVEL